MEIIGVKLDGYLTSGLNCSNHLLEKLLSNHSLSQIVLRSKIVYFKLKNSLHPKHNYFGVHLHWKNNISQTQFTSYALESTL